MCTLPQPFHLSEKKAKQEKPATVTKFESTAEKITAFHKRTPERFHVRPRSMFLSCALHSCFRNLSAKGS